MELLRWMGWMYARFVAVSVAILGGVLFFNNLADKGFEFWAWVWILVSGVLGMVGGVIYLLTIDGPPPMRRRWIRSLAWASMLGAVVLPTTLTLMLAPLTLLLLPTLFVGWSKPNGSEEDEGVVTSS